ncbi:LuxR C-terminal-related transcriptional regulator [uncultured Adlercreutzia sp.]|uniref:helix-turn-helix transcriptional regulator n=1 Tax=uncultured Adlercreutzia sp. TaxID=875803 RepID=UPI0025DC3267|nr:LuxR C-terminal-related transcriptional regulator [uncultured Adlercreutzia sp.]
MRPQQPLDHRLLLFGAFFATMPLYAPNAATFARALSIADDGIRHFALPMLAVALASGLAISLFGRKGRAGLVTESRPWGAAGAVVYLGGLALLVFDALGVVAEPFSLAKLAAGALCGFGLTVLCCQWGLKFSKLDIRAALLHLSLACGLGSLASLGLAALSGVAYFIGFFSLAVAGSLGASAGSAIQIEGEQGSREPDKVVPPDSRERPLWPAPAELAPSEPARRCGGRLDTLRRLASVAALPCLGLAVFSLVMSLRKFSLFGTFDIELIAGIVAAGIALLLCMAPLRRPFYSFGYEEFLPACALVLIVCSCFPVGSAVQVLSAALMYVVFALVALFALASIVAVVHAREFPPLTVLGLTPALIAASSLFGIAGSSLMPEDAVGPSLLVVAVAYFAGLIMTAIVSLARAADRSDTIERPDLRDTPHLAALFQQRCEEVGASCGLSPRETEIMQMLGRGHNPTFIARTLVLSLSTVRTHIRNLYKKMNVSNQEELIALIDGEPSPS